MRRDAKQGGLPCSVVAEQRDKLARSNFERDTAKRDERAEAPLDFFETDTDA